MESNGCNNNSGVDPKQVIKVEPRMINQCVNFGGAIGLFCFFILLALLLSSCTPQKRLNRLVKKNPELIKIDTVRIVDTIVIESFHFDTTTKFIEHYTVEVINNERVRLQYRYDTITKEIWHEVICHGDTIIKTHEVTHPTIVNTIDYFSGIYKWGVLLLLIVIVFGAIKILK